MNRRIIGLCILGLLVLTIVVFTACIEEKGVTSSTPTPIPTPEKAKAKPVPWRIPPVEEGVTPKSLGSKERGIIDYDYDPRGVLIKATRGSVRTVTWGDKKGNPLYIEERTSLYTHKGPSMYGTYLATEITSTFTWEGESAERESKVEPNPIFSPCQITTIWEDSKPYCYTSIENKANPGNVTFIMIVEVIKTGEIYTFSKVFHMDKNEKVKAVVHLPEDFPRESIIVTEFPHPPSEEILTKSSFKVRPSLPGDTSQGEIDIERI